MNIKHQIDAMWELLELYRDVTKKRWSRNLPLDEMIFERGERAIYLGFGVDTTIYHNSYVYGDVKVGDNTWIGPFTILDGTGGLTIGSNCSISAGVHIYSHSTVKWAVTGGEAPYEYAPVEIGDNCYIGPHAVIAMGSKIETGTIVPAHSLIGEKK